MFESMLSGTLAQMVFVFVLVFTLIFGILQKTKLLGDGKKQIDALVSLSLALIVVSVGYALDLITKLVPILGVGLVLILVFILLIGLFFKDSFEAPGWMRNTAIVLAFLAVLISVLYFTGFYQKIFDLFKGGNSWFGNIVLIVVVVVVFIIAFTSKDK